MDNRDYRWVVYWPEGHRPPHGLFPERMTCEQMNARIAAGEFVRADISTGAEDLALAWDHIYDMNTPYGRRWHPHRGWQMGTLPLSPEARAEAEESRQRTREHKNDHMPDDDDD
jgi:hypothetical protein